MSRGNPADCDTTTRSVSKGSFKGNATRRFDDVMEQGCVRGVRKDEVIERKGSFA